MTLIYYFDFWSAISGMSGTLLIFIFGLPPKIDIDGEQHLVLEQIDENEKKKANRYKNFSYFGLGLIFLSFSLQLIELLTGSY